VEPCRAPGDVLVAGVGNPSRGDDGAGPEVVRLLEGRVPPHVRLATVAADPLALIETWDGASHVVAVDAMRTGAPPGTVRRLEVTAPGGGHGLVAGAATSSHGFGLAETLALAGPLGRMPPRVTVFGIEAAAFDPGAPLSPPVAAAVTTVAERILGELDMSNDVPSTRPPLAPSTKPSLARAVLTDLHFWVPVIVLALGVALLVLLA
jgi:hydrogenase maturation protease